MQRATQIIELPALTVDFPHPSGLLMNNVFAGLRKQVDMKILLLHGEKNVLYNTMN